MARKISYFGVYQRGKLVQTLDENREKRPLIFISRKAAEETAELRASQLKKPNEVKKITI